MQILYAKMSSNGQFGQNGHAIFFERCVQKNALFWGKSLVVR